MQTPSTSKKRSRTAFESPSYSRQTTTVTSINSQLIRSLLGYSIPDAPRAANLFIDKLRSSCARAASFTLDQQCFQSSLTHLNTRIVQALDNPETSPALLSALAIVLFSVQPHTTSPSNVDMSYFTSLSPTLTNIKQLSLEYYIPSSQFLYCPQPSLPHTMYTISEPDECVQPRDHTSNAISEASPSTHAGKNVPRVQRADDIDDIEDFDEDTMSFPLFSAASSSSMQSVFDKSKHSSQRAIDDNIMMSRSASDAQPSEAKRVKLPKNSPEHALMTTLQKPHSKYITAFPALKSASIYARQLLENDGNYTFVEQESSSTSHKADIKQFPLHLSRNFKIPKQSIWEIQVATRSPCLDMTSLVPFAILCSYFFDSHTEPSQLPSTPTLSAHAATITPSASMTASLSPLSSTSSPASASSLLPVLSRLNQLAALADVECPLWSAKLSSCCLKKQKASLQDATSDASRGIFGSPSKSSKTADVVPGGSLRMSDDTIPTQQQWTNSHEMHTYTPEFSSHTGFPDRIKPISLSHPSALERSGCCCIDCAVDAWEQFLRDVLQETLGEVPNDAIAATLSQLCRPCFHAMSTFSSNVNQNNDKSRDLFVYGANSLLLFSDCARTVGGDVSDVEVQRKSGRILDLLSSHPEIIVGLNKKMSAAVSDEGDSSPHESMTSTSPASNDSEHPLFSSSAPSNGRDTFKNQAPAQKNTLFRFFTPVSKKQATNTCGVGGSGGNEERQSDMVMNTGSVAQHSATMSDAEAHGNSSVLIRGGAGDLEANVGKSARGQCIRLNGTVIRNYDQLRKLLQVSTHRKVDWEKLREVVDDEAKKTFTLVDTDKVEGQTQQLLADMFKKMML